MNEELRQLIEGTETAIADTVQNEAELQKEYKRLRVLFPDAKPNQLWYALGRVSAGQ